MNEGKKQKEKNIEVKAAKNLLKELFINLLLNIPFPAFAYISIYPNPYTYTSTSCRNDAHRAWQTMKIGE
jgi:hypothetical protein